MFHLCGQGPSLVVPRPIRVRKHTTMSLVHLSNVCSHLQNASKGRLGLTSIPYTKLHSAISSTLLKAGFISHMTIGGPNPPSGDPSPILGHAHPPAEETTITRENRASRRLWLGLKYWNNEPVINKMSMISKPTRRIWVGADEMAKLSKGYPISMVQGMRQVGEVILVSTDRGIMDLRECVERGIGGQLLCRVW